MIGVIVTILICVWIYRSANELNLNPLKWIALALIAYYAASFGWTYLVLKPLLSAAVKGPSVSSGILIEVTGPAVGAALIAFLRKRFMLTATS